jgi:metal-sulfur cluster biosynthetic enzyme
MARFIEGTWLARCFAGIAMPGYPAHPPHPERVCWGCDQCCPAEDPACGRDTVRTPHPVELFGDDWQHWAEDSGDTVDDTTRAQVVEALRGVLDPEVGINIVDLGVVYEVRVDGSSVRISLTMTSPSCPLGEQIQLEATRRIRALKGVTDVRVVLLWDPPWSPERMSSAARAALGSVR